jgi:release factor glutamine methyltransferase
VARLRAAGCVFAEDEARLLVEAASSLQALESMVTRRVGGEPLEHVLGWVAFAGLRLVVAPGVFVPRRRTELLADLAAAHLRRADEPVLVELCCGVGAVSAAVLAALPGVTVHASDVDPAAVACARANLPLPAEVAVGDLDGAVPDDLRGRVDVLVANTPYVPSREVATMPREARDHEPLLALDGGADGLALARRVVAVAGGWLQPGGIVAVETSVAQAPVLAAAMVTAGLTAAVRSDPDRDATAVVGTAP